MAVGEGIFVAVAVGRGVAVGGWWAVVGLPPRTLVVNSKTSVIIINAAPVRMSSGRRNLLNEPGGREIAGRRAAPACVSAGCAAVSLVGVAGALVRVA